jgi:hypothetical protein
MTKTLAELIERACDIQVNLGVFNYELNHYDDGSYVDFHADKIMNVPLLLELAGGLDLKMFPDEGFIRVRLYERYENK